MACQGHSDYLQSGHLHSVCAAHADEHAIGVGGVNPASGTQKHTCGRVWASRRPRRD
jgi:hypothetical protein